MYSCTSVHAYYVVRERLRSASSFVTAEQRFKLEAAELQFKFFVDFLSLVQSLMKGFISLHH
jgi:hypothetical protein